jgi:protein-tyrosine phosphatase
MDKVHNQLYISDIVSVREQSIPGEVDAVINVCQDDTSDNVGVAYCHFPLSDGETDMYGGDSSYEGFETAADEILERLESGETLLVHCHMGHSRSVATSIAAVAVYEDSNWYDVYDVFKSERPGIHPNMQLQDYARQFIGERT